MELIQNIYKSRFTILEMLEDRGYDVNKYKNFTVDEVNVWFNQSTKNKSSALTKPGPLDLLIEKEGMPKTYIKYRLERYRANKPVIKQIEKIYSNEEDVGVLNKDDTLVLIVIENMNQLLNLEKPLANLYDEYGYFVQAFNLDILQINITKSYLTSPHRILNTKESEELLERLDAKKEDLPIIRRLDAMAKYYAMKPGDICEIQRFTETSGIGYYYRHCVHV